MQLGCSCDLKWNRVLLTWSFHRFTHKSWSEMLILLSTYTGSIVVRIWQIVAKAQNPEVKKLDTCIYSSYHFSNGWTLLLVIISIYGCLVFWRKFVWNWAISRQWRLTGDRDRWVVRHRVTGKNKEVWQWERRWRGRKLSWSSKSWGGGAR